MAVRQCCPEHDFNVVLDGSTPALVHKNQCRDRFVDKLEVEQCNLQYIVVGRGYPCGGWWIFILVVVAVLFPRIVALLLSLVIRLITRAFLSLAMHVFKEVWSQAMMAVAEFERGVAQWLYLQLGMIVAVEPAPPPLLANGPTASPQLSTTGSGHSHPTRPIDVPIDGAHARPWSPTTPTDWGGGGDTK